MSDMLRDPRREFIAREWPYLLCALLAVLLLLLPAVAPQPAQTPPADTAAAQAQAAAQEAQLHDLLSRHKSLLAALGTALIILILASLAWLAHTLAVRRDIFPPAELPAAAWNEWDIVKSVILFILLVSAFVHVIQIEHPGLILLAQNLASVATALIILRIIRTRQDPAAALGLSLRQLGRRLFPALALFFAFIPIFYGLSVLWMLTLRRLSPGPVETSQPLVRDVALSSSIPEVAQIVIAAVLIAPLFEELFFRGFLYRLLRRRLHPAFAIPAVGVIFGAFHAPLAVAVPMAFLGAFLCYVYEKTGRLTVPIVIHALFNLSTIARIILARTL